MYQIILNVLNTLRRRQNTWNIAKIAGLILTITLLISVFYCFDPSPYPYSHSHFLYLLRVAVILPEQLRWQDKPAEFGSGHGTCFSSSR